MNKKKIPTIAICSWASGIGGGAGRMESYYFTHYNRERLNPIFISLVPRRAEDPQYGIQIPYIQLEQSHRFSHLCDILHTHDVDIIQFQGSFDPLVCEAFRYTSTKLLIEVLHNIETGGLFPHIDHSICVSHAVAAVQNPSHAYSVIHNGIDLSLFPYQRKYTSTDKIIFLQVARKEKATINLIDMVDIIGEHIPHSEFWVCGAGHTQIDNPRVRYLGVVEDVLSLYHQADFLIQLSDNEPFGLVALEAMASGTPVILARSGGFTEIVSHAEDGFLISCGNSQVAAQEICNIILNAQNNFELISQNARKKVESSFDITKTVNAYEDLILKKYEEKCSSTDTRVSVPLGMPANAIIGEALYDFQSQNIELMAHHLSQLLYCEYPITEMYCLKTAHDLTMYIHHNVPHLYARGIWCYLFSCGDITEECLRMLIEEIDILLETEHIDDYEKYIIYRFPENQDLLIALIRKYTDLELMDKVRTLNAQLLTQYNNETDLQYLIHELFRQILG